ncbi:MAG: exonuclease SbcCD subunit D [Clostridia bacterium]|nr:exonuclease SbcCD subunit D [Clostridia bacterium]
MKFIHLSDLHLGKRVNEFSMIEDQAYILNQILEIIDKEAPDGVLIAGDVYDKSVPLAEAVRLFDDFLFALSTRSLKVFIVSGNHDSAERLSFASRLIHKNGIYISPVYNGEILPTRMEDTFGAVNVYMLPFVKPSNVRRYFEEEEIGSYTDAIRVAIQGMKLNHNERNVLVAHQFVTGASRSDSEEISVGGTDNVDASVFADFDYVALGHLHGPQNCGTDKIRYCGTPLKYSFSEAKHHKSVTVIELEEKGKLSVRTVDLIPLRDLVEIKGKYNDLMLKSFYEHKSYDTDYVHVTLTDEEDIPDAISKLRTVYKNLMKLDYDNTRTQSRQDVDGATDVEEKSPHQLFAELFELQNNLPMSQEQGKLIDKLIEQIWEGDI